MNKTLVVFKIGEQKFCTNILNIKEVCQKNDFVNLPNSLSFVDGVMKLRDEVIYVINLSRKMSISQKNSVSSKVIIISLSEFLVGFIVDDIVGIINVNDNNLDQIPDIVKDSNFTSSGVVKFHDEIILQVDFNTILSESEISSINEYNKEMSDD